MLLMRLEFAYQQVCQMRYVTFQLWILRFVLLMRVVTACALLVCLQSSDEVGAGDINSEVFFEEGFDVSWI